MRFVEGCYQQLSTVHTYPCRNVNCTRVLPQLLTPGDDGYVNKVAAWRRRRGSPFERRSAPRVVAGGLPLAQTTEQVDEEQGEAAGKNDRTAARQHVQALPAHLV